MYMILAPHAYIDKQINQLTFGATFSLPPRKGFFIGNEN